MKTKEEASSINKLMSCLVNFLNMLAEETHYNYSYPIADYEYDNNTETIHLIYEDGSKRDINVNIDSVSASMKDALKHTLFEMY